MQIFKIRRSDGLFSTGSSSPRFKKLGKVWTQKNHLTNHLRQVYHIEKIYKDCEVVVYEITELEVGTFPSISQCLEEMQERDLKKEEIAKKRYEEYQKQLRLKQFEALKKEFE